MSVIPSPKQPRQRSFTIGDRKIVAIGAKHSFWHDFSHSALTVSWPVFIAATALGFVLLNCLFALAYFLGNAPVTNVPGHDFLEYFYFSIETLATVGYGDMHPQSHYGHVIASIESFTGIFCIALMTGLIFSRFSRPQARLLFVSNPIISTLDAKPVFMLRVANERHNSISDATARLWFLRRYGTTEGRSYYGFVEMKLVRNENPTFRLSWSLFHTIDETSPLFGLGSEDLASVNARFTVTLNGYDENSAQPVHSRKDYACSDLRWNHRYIDILATTDNVTTLDYGKFHDSEPDV